MDLLEDIAGRIGGQLGLLTRDQGMLRVPAEAPRFGPVEIRIEHDTDAETLRVCVALTPPLGAGSDFLLWCLAVSERYFHVKIGLDAEGMLLFHADLDADDEVIRATLAEAVVDRTETILALLDDDLVPFLLSRSLGSAQQLARWQGPWER